jgi:hypothetical protein
VSTCAAFHLPDPDDDAEQQRFAAELLGREFVNAQLAAIHAPRDVHPRYTPDSDRTPAAEPLFVTDPDPEC